jgi:basic membrane protein A
VRRAVWVLVVMTVLAIALTFLPARHAVVASAAVARPRARVGLVFDVGGLGDKSFNDAAYNGLVKARDELGVEIAYIEPTGSEDREAGLRLFASRNMDLVVAVGFIFSTDVEAVARAYPNVHFACVDYAPVTPAGPPSNVAGLAFREEEGSFLVGALAGLVSKTHHTGFVGGMTIPLIRKFEVGFAAGVHAGCPDCEVHVGYAGATPEGFKDPAKGKTLAISQISAGADVLFHAAGATGHGVFEGARDAKVFAIGVDADQFDEAPDVMLTSMVKRVDVAVLDAIRSVVEGRFTGGIHELGLKEHAVDYVHEGPHAVHVPAEARARVERFREDVIAGKIVVPSN